MLFRSVKFSLVPLTTVEFPSCLSPISSLLERVNDTGQTQSGETLPLHSDFSFPSLHAPPPEAQSKCIIDDGGQESTIQEVAGEKYECAV